MTKKMTEHDDAQDCGLLIKHINDELARDINNDLRKHSLTVSQIRYMLFVQEYKEKEVPLAEVCSHLAVSQPTVAGITKRLQKKNLITVTVDPNDGRARNIQLTAKGKKVLQDGETQKSTNEARLNHALNKKEQQEFKQLLNKVNVYLAQH